MFSVVIATRKRAKQLIETLKTLENFSPDEIIIVVNNCSETEKNLTEHNFNIPIIVLENTSNIGAGKAKHKGIKAAKSEKILVLDDDAEIIDGSDLKFCLDSLEKYSLIQGLIVSDANLSRRLNEQPFLINKKRSGDHTISYFVGACHFIRRKQFLKAGGYENAALYGFEELELSINLSLRGEKMLFTDKFIVNHKKAPEGRQLDDELKQNLLKERIRIGYEYYPFLFSFLSAIVWNMKTFKTLKFKVLPKYNPKPKITMRELSRNPRLFVRALF